MLVHINMSKENMVTLLNLSVGSRDALRELLEMVIEQLFTERETADMKDNNVVPDSQSAQDRVDEESKCMSLMQDLKKENNDLSEETYKLKKEVKILQNQLSQCLTQENVQTALDIERQKIIKELKDSITGTGHIYSSTEISVPQTSRDTSAAVSDESLSQLGGQTLSQVSSGSEHYLEALEALKDISQLHEKHRSLESRLEHLEAVSDEALPQLGGQSLSQVSSGVEHYPEALEALKDITQLQETHRSLESRIERLEALPQLGGQSLSQVSTGVEHYPEALEALKDITQLQEKHRSLESRLELLEAVSDEAPPQLAGQTLSQKSSGVEHHPEAVATLVNMDQLQEMHKSLEARIEHLEGERENLMDQVNQLKSQLMETTATDKKRVHEMEPMAMGPVSSVISEELVKSQAADSQSRDGISEAKHPEHLHLQTADQWNEVQKMDMHDVKQELLAVKEEQKRSPDKELNEKHLYKSVKELDDTKRSYQRSFLVKMEDESLQSAAGLNRQLITNRIRCLYCDRLISIKSLERPTLVLPKLPSFPPSKQQSNFHRRRVQSVPVCDSYTIHPKEEYWKNSPSTSRRVKSLRLQPLRPQASNTDLICIGTSCFKQEKMWYPAASLP